MAPPKNKRLKLIEAQNDQDSEDDQHEPFKRKTRASTSAKKLHEPEESSILSLNDDCLRDILDKLSLDDLCAISQTCVRFQELSIDHFRRRHKEKVMIIENVQDGTWNVQPDDEKYVECFAIFIQNISIGKSCASNAALRELSTFYASDENAAIKELRFENWRPGILKSHGNSLAFILKDVESVTFSKTAVLGDLHDFILQFMPNMKSLTLWKNFTEPENKTDWMNKTYPNLEHFAWHLESKEVPIARIKHFLDINPNIRSFSLQSKSPKTLNQLILQSIRVNELFFEVDRVECDVSTVLDDLRIFFKQQPNSRLHLKCGDAIRKQLNFDKLANLGPYIEGLYFEKGVIDAKLAKQLVTFENLKVLQVELGIRNAKQLAAIPNLEEIFVYWGVNKQNFTSYSSSLLEYASQLPNLKKIYLRNNTIPFEKFNFKGLQRARRKLPGAQKLQIYFKTDETSHTGKLNKIDRNYGMIEVVRVETENVKNPLVTEYLTTQRAVACTSYNQRYRRYRRFKFQF